MKTLSSFLLVICTLLLHIPVTSARALIIASQSISPNESQSMPTREVIYDNSGITVRYSIDAVNFADDNLYEGSNWTKINGFGQTYEPETPSLPFRSDSFNLPEGCDSAVVKIVNANFIDYNCEVTPSRPLLPDSEYISYTKANVKPIVKSAFTSPENIITGTKIRERRHKYILNVGIMPIQYNLSTKTIRIYSNFEYRIDFIKKNITGIPKPTNINIDDIIVARPNAKHPDSVDNASYLIISIPEHESACTKFTEWKNLLGIKTNILLNDNWTSSLVKNCISDYYKNDTNLHYVLLVGANDQIPGCNVLDIEKNIYLSDIPYSFLGKNINDDYPDIYIGRILANNNIECLNIINKIIEYEQNPVQDPYYYISGTNCAYFQTTPYSHNKTIEETRFVKTSEEIRDYIMKYHNKNITRIYTKEKDATPTYWNPSNYGNGSLIPNELRDSTFNWNGNASDIVNAINNGCFYLLYRGHGDYNLWKKPLFNIRYLNLLKNKTSIIFSITCKTGNYKYSCLAEEFLKKENSGCVGIFAASEVTYSGLNDAMTHGMFNAIWPKPGLYPSINSEIKPEIPNTTIIPKYILGEILEAGNLRMEELYYNLNEYMDYTIRNRKRFHIFGDPSMMMFTDVPLIVDDNKITINNSPVTEASGKYYINLKIQQVSNSDCYLAVSDKDKQTRYVGKDFEFADSVNMSTTFYLYGPNIYPKRILPILSIKPTEKAFKVLVDQNSKTCHIKFTENSIPKIAVIRLTKLTEPSHTTEFTLNPINGNGTIDISRLSPGTYIITIIGDGVNMGSEKIQINH